MCKAPTKYVVCYKHRNTVYFDICKIHGRTRFINGKCVLCHTPSYRIVDHKDRFGNKIGKNHILYQYLPFKKKKKRISHISGIYGIFYHNRCIYVGQSTDISRRIQQHKDCFKIAQNHLRGLRIHKKRIHLSKVPYKVEYKYYQMASEYKWSDLTFKTLWSMKKYDGEVITYAEQAMIDLWRPKFNKIAAIPNRKERF